MLKLAKEYLKNDPDKAMVIAKEALTLSKQRIFKKWVANSFFRIAKIHRKLGDYEKIYI